MLLSIAGREENIIPVADSGFLRRGGTNPQNWDARLLFWPIFPENCTKLKEIGGLLWRPLPWDPPMYIFLTFIDLKHFSGSFIMSAFTSNFYTLFLTFGIMAGAAQSFVFVGGASILYSYFKEKRGLATSKYYTSPGRVSSVASKSSDCGLHPQCW